MHLYTFLKTWHSVGIQKNTYWMNEWKNEQLSKQTKVTEDGNDKINLKGVMVEKEECTVLLKRL